MKKIKIKISAHYYPEAELLKQNIDLSTKYKNCEFFINKDVDECDFWFIYDGFPKEEQAICPKENIVLITGEPTAVKTYHQKFINQYSFIYTCQEVIYHHNKIYNQLIPWYVEKSYSELVNSKSEKTKLLSVICSSKAITEGHKKRLEFVTRLQSYFGDSLDVFGRGIREIPQKWDAIAPYKYHLVLENNIENHYWTEKLADSFLAGAYPIYSGCPNISEYFNGNCFSKIDVNKPDEAIMLIEKIVSANTYENTQNELQEAKELVLNKYNMLFVLAEFAIKNHKSDAEKQENIIKSDPYFRRFENAWIEFKRRPFIYPIKLFRKFF